MTCDHFVELPGSQKEMRKFGGADLRGLRHRVMFDRILPGPKSRSYFPRSFQLHEKDKDRHQHPNYRILAQQRVHRLLSHYCEYASDCGTIALCHIFDFGAPADGHAQTINDNIADLVCVLVLP